MNEAFYQKLMQVVNKNQILIEEPLARHTTFQVGGPAQFLIVPESITQIKELVDLCTKEDMDLFVMGNGSNLLVSDIGFRGVVIKLCHAFSNIAISKIDFDNTKEYFYTLPEQLDKNETWYQVTAESGVMLSKLANLVADESLEGFEFAAGIPGTLGGAVTMNAGAYDGEIKNSVIGATVLDRKGNIYKLNKEELKLGYRKSIIQDNNYIVLDATFLFKIGKKEEIRNKINDLNARRRDKQPLEYPSAGSTFKRPNGYFAGKLIMDSGLRGYQLGNAQVSEKHCGFVINRGGATAAEVRALISEIIRIVYEKHGVMLEPEVKLLGEF